MEIIFQLSNPINKLLNLIADFTLLLIANSEQFFFTLIQFIFKRISFYKNCGQLIQQETVKLPEKSKSLSFKSSKDLSVSLYADPLSISTVGIHWMSATNKFFVRVSTAWLVTVCK